MGRDIGPEPQEDVEGRGQLRGQNTQEARKQALGKNEHRPRLRSKRLTLQEQWVVTLTLVSPKVKWEEESREKAKKEQGLKELYEQVKELDFYLGHYKFF